MPKILSPLNIIKEKKASEVFFSLIRCMSKGYTKPGDIAKDCKMFPSSVTDNLKKLSYARIVLNNKDKYLYSPNWEGLMKLSLDRFREKSFLIHLSKCEYMKNKPSKEKVMRILKRADCIEFTNALRDYFLNFPYSPDNIDEAIETFESKLFQFDKIKGNSPFKKLLREWGKLIQTHEQPYDDAFCRAMEWK